MNPIKTAASGFFPFARFAGVVDWSALPAVVAVQGDNGEGKSSLLALDFLALYGRDPNPARGSIHDCLRFAGAPDGWIETTFSVRGKIYRVRREASVSPQRHQAWLYRIEDGGGTVTCLAGPLVRDTGAAVAELVGDADNALATWFSAQGGHGDLCSLESAEIRAAFAKILRFAKIQEWADAAKAKASEAKGIADHLDAEIAGAPDLRPELARLESSAASAAERADKASAQLPIAEAELDAARAELARAEAATVEDLRAIIAESERATVEARAAADRVNHAFARRRATQSAAAGLATAETQVAELAAARAEADALLDRSERYRAWREWDQRRAALAAQIESEESRLADAARVAAVSPEDVSTAADLAALRIAYRNAEAENIARRERNAERAKRRSRLGAKIEAKRADHEQLNGEIADAPKLPGPPDVCATCPLAARFAKLPAQRDKIVAELAAAVAELDAMEPYESELDLSELRRQGESARDAKARIDAAESARQLLESAKAARAAAVALHDAHMAAPAPEETDPTPAIRANQTRLNELSGAEERLAQAREAVAALPVLEIECEKAISESAAAADRDDAAFKRAEDARAALADAEAALQSVRARVESAKAAVANLRHDLAEAAQDRANALGAAETIRDRMAELESKRAKAREARARHEGFKKLAECYGPRGAQAILIDRAVPELEAIVSAMLAEISGSTMRVRFHTQSANKNGGMKEDFVISFADADGERDVAAISGGEQRIVRTAIKLALAEWIAKLHGVRAEHIRLDEAMDALDPTNAEAMVALIRAHGERIGKAIVVTHDPDVAARFPARLIVAGGMVDAA